METRIIALEVAASLSERREATLENTVVVLLRMLAENRSLRGDEIAIMRRSISDRERDRVVPGLIETGDLLPVSPVPTAEVYAYRQRGAG